MGLRGSMLPPSLPIRALVDGFLTARKEGAKGRQWPGMRRRMEKIFIIVGENIIMR